jgi:hypothetical protein
VNDLTAVVIERLTQTMPPYREAMRFAMARQMVADGAAVKGMGEDEWAAWFHDLMSTDERMPEFHEHMRAIVAHREANP